MTSLIKATESNDLTPGKQCRGEVSNGSCYIVCLNKSAEKFMFDGAMYYRYFLTFAANNFR